MAQRVNFFMSTGCWLSPSNLVLIGLPPRPISKMEVLESIEEEEVSLTRINTQGRFVVVVVVVFFTDKTLPVKNHD